MLLRILLFCLLCDVVWAQNETYGVIDEYKGNSATKLFSIEGIQKADKKLDSISRANSWVFSGKYSIRMQNYKGIVMSNKISFDLGYVVGNKSLSRPNDVNKILNELVDSLHRIRLEKYGTWTDDILKGKYLFTLLTPFVYRKNKTPKRIDNIKQKINFRGGVSISDDYIKKLDEFKASGNFSTNVSNNDALLMEYVNNMDEVLGGKNVKRDDVTIVYNAGVETEGITDKTKTILKEVASVVGLKSITISSSRRSVEKQAEAMFKNAKTNLKAQYTLYGHYGDIVLKVFADKYQGDNNDEVIQLMIDKINEIGPYNVSNHLANFEAYKKLNVIDISCNVLGNKTTNFIEEVKKQSGVRANKVIDECSISNKAVHVEINQ